MLMYIPFSGEFLALISVGVNVLFDILSSSFISFCEELGFVFVFVFVFEGGVEVGLGTEVVVVVLDDIG